ncbi:hypothetical protein DU484_00350 (plasmid) [Haloplanus rubicundus]|uniref:Uncharacterized protein n=2 Tax=Haloplanus rubicundus TaxID=1547898 RepID=A0A345E897_9EURY|nr:hypothetical protein DU484_00350 [Haloplanus rubicundus]
MVAGKPKIPDISGAVATFDLTGDEWELEFRADSVRVERDGKDALEYVEAIVETGFAGDLGYLVVNIPSDWADPIRGDVFERIHERIAPTPGTDASSTIGSENATTDLPLVTRCHPDENIQLPADASVYWFGQRMDLDDESVWPDTIEGWEDRFDRSLRNLDWLPTVLTEEHEGNESTEHYLIKGATAGLLVRAAHDDAESETLEEYVFETVLRNDELETESGEDPCVDVHASFDDALDSCIPWPDEVDDSADLVIEVETGRGEGSTQFRKFWHTIDRLADDEYADDFVCVVVPPRLLAKTKKQAEYLCKLVKLWNRRVDLTESDIEGPYARLAVPVFDESGSCQSLREAEAFVEEVYDRE